MPRTKSGTRSTDSGERERVDYHADGSVRARGRTRNGVLVGYWEWFRKDGTKLRSGHFENGEQAGEWTSYDSDGAPYKTTVMKPNPGAGHIQRPAKPVAARRKG